VFKIEGIECDQEGVLWSADCVCRGATRSIERMRAQFCSKISMRDAWFVRSLTAAPLFLASAKHPRRASGATNDGDTGNGEQS
jgi:hypothetical protein